MMSFILTYDPLLFQKNLSTTNADGIESETPNVFRKADTPGTEKVVKGLTLEIETNRLTPGGVRTVTTGIVSTNH